VLGNVLTILVGLSLGNKQKTIAKQILGLGPISFQSLKWESKGYKGFKYHIIVIYMQIFRQVVASLSYCDGGGILLY
jgi:hypothetical protein